MDHSSGLVFHRPQADSNRRSIVYFCSAVLTGSAIADLRENVTLTTASKVYAWVNTVQIWATGTVDLAEQVVRVKAYAA